jgi:hypothetical protein
VAESNRKLSAPLQKFATDLKAVLLKTETQIREMRAREASTKERKLEKHELCPLCGGPDVNGRCKCIETLQKNNSGTISAVGGGTQPMAMAELCKNCGKAHDMGKCDMDDVRPGKDLAKKTPEGISEKTMHKLKDEYGHDKEGKSKAYATANAIANGTVNHKAEMKTTPHLDDVKPGLAKMGMPTSSAAALAPKKPAPTTPIHQANQELGSMTSLAHSPTAMPGTAPKKPIAHMGRTGGSGFSMTAGGANTPRASVSGSIPNAKAELNPGSASKYGTGGPGHATQANMPSALKAVAAPVAKGENAMVYPKVAAEKAVDGAKAPKKGKDATPDKQGSGGEIKAGKGLSKAAPAMAKAPAGKGVPGKQPVGQGGGDAHKLPAAASAAKPGAQKPAAKPAVGSLKTAGAAEAGRLKGNANVQRLRGDLANVQAQKDKAQGIDLASLASGAKAHAGSVDVDVSDFDKGPANATLGQRLKANPAAAAPAGGGADALSGARDKMNLAAASKQKGGVGFLRGLFSMFHSPKAQAPAPGAPQQQGSLTSKRFHGTTALQRGEMDMRKAALSLTKKDLEADELDKGLMSANHNRRMLSVTPKRRGKKNR